MARCTAVLTTELCYSTRQLPLNTFYNLLNILKTQDLLGGEHQRTTLPYSALEACVNERLHELPSTITMDGVVFLDPDWPVPVRHIDIEVRKTVHTLRN
jgi:hypothetical protein